MTPEELLRHARRFAFPINIPNRHPVFDAVTVEWRANDAWAVVYYSHVLNIDSKLEYELQPSSRVDEFKKRTRFSLVEAVERAQTLVASIRDAHNTADRMQKLYEQESL